jgi:glutamate---cysteine ligase / carboxylate-amine ligase
VNTPLTIVKAAQIAAYIQTVARWQMREKTFVPNEDDYLVYTFNRFQACRFGFDGTIVDPKSGEHRTLRDDILATLDAIEAHAGALQTEAACLALREDVSGKGNDATWLRALQKRERLLPEVVRQQCLRW